MAGVLLMAMGAGSVTTVFVPTKTVQSLGIGSAQASLMFNTDGLYHENGVAMTTRWVTGDTPSSYQVWAEVVSGSPTFGTFNAWLPLTSARTYTLQRTANGTSTCAILFKLRDASLNERASGTVTFQATVESA